MAQGLHRARLCPVGPAQRMLEMQEERKNKKN